MHTNNPADNTKRNTFSPIAKNETPPSDNGELEKKFQVFLKSEAGQVSLATAFCTRPLRVAFFAGYAACELKLEEKA